MFVVDRPHPRRTTAQLNAQGGFVFDRGNPGNVGLLHRAGAPFPLYVREVEVALFVLQRGIVEVDIFGRGDAVEFTLADRDQHLRQGNRAQAVRGFGWGFRLVGAALGAVDIE